LEIGKLNNDDRGPGVSPEPSGVITDLDLGRSQQDGYAGLLPEVFQVFLPTLLEFRLFQCPLELPFDFLEGGIQPVLLALVSGH
jgi:hypothetical protein